MKKRVRARPEWNSKDRIIRLAKEIGVYRKSPYEQPTLTENGKLFGKIGFMFAYVYGQWAHGEKALRFVQQAFPFLEWKRGRCKNCDKTHLLWRPKKKSSRWKSGCVEIWYNRKIWSLEKPEKPQLEDFDGKETADSE